MKTPPIVSAEDWEAERQRLLVQEKELTRARDAMAARRRRMPWLAVDREYAFDGPEGRVSLPDLFAGRRQLIVYRAFADPGLHGWPDHGCVGCSMVADQVAHPAHPAHLNASRPERAGRRPRLPHVLHQRPRPARLARRVPRGRAAAGLTAAAR